MPARIVEEFYSNTNEMRIMPDYTLTEILAVDADIVAYRVACVCEDAPLSVLQNAVDEFIHAIARDSGVTKMVMFLSDVTNFRYEVAKTKPYKGNRVNVVRPPLLAPAKEYIREKYRGMSIENYEADDCIASYMTQHKNVAHAGIDKDIRQVLGWHFNFVKRIWEHTNEDDSQLLLYRQICRGDTSDNIPGLPGVGEKTAEKAITDPELAYLDTIRLYRNTFDNLSEAKAKRAFGEEWQKYIGMTPDKLMEYLGEQTKLIRMVTDIEIEYDSYVTVEVPPIFDTYDEEDGWIGDDTKLEL